MACGNWRRREDVGVLQRGKGAAPIQCVADSQVFNQIQFGSGAVGDVMASLARCWALTAASDPEPVAVKYQARASDVAFVVLFEVKGMESKSVH
jgi:hypothetical protein